MSLLKKYSGVMEHPAVYRIWQAPFVQSKIEPILKHNDLTRVSRVLDVGCGPGTNTSLFPAACLYHGIDINERYIHLARQRHPERNFDVADVGEYRAEAENYFDFILINSLLHHLDNDAVFHILRQTHDQLGDSGAVHVIELVMPPSPSIAQYLARSDRGDYPRPLGEWKRIFTEVFQPQVFEPFDVKGLGVPLWNMVYFKGMKKA